MALNMSKNGVELMAAYKDVVDGHSDINWVLFTYEGNSNTMRVAGKGGGGLEEMVEELNSGKVMYAFCRVEDPNSGLPKYVLINWTGEGVKESRKGLCANHLGTVANFLKGAHVTINARDEDDVDPDVILSKVSKASGANYNFHKPANPQPGDVPRGAVGSVYCKTNAMEEIQQINKDSFWSQAQKEEEMRRKEEVKKAQLQRQAVEQERRDLEEKHAVEREKIIHQRNIAIDQNRLLQKQMEEEEREKEQQRRNLQKNETSSVVMRQATSAQGASEAKALISQRSFNPRDVFKQKETAFDHGYGGSAHTAGKLRSPFLSQQGFDSPQPLPGFQAIQPLAPTSILTPETSPTRSPYQPSDFAVSDQTSVPVSWTTSSSPRPDTTSIDDFLSRPAVSLPVMPATVSVPTQAAAEDDDWSDEFDDDLYEVVPGLAPNGQRMKSLADAMFPTDLQEREYTVPAPTGGAVLFEDAGQDANTGQDDNATANAEQNICAKAVYDYQAADDTEITFDPDDIITGIEMVDEGWWRGYGPDGHYGMFPANYVELL
ncbi:drebrin-like protein B isoform X2 [Hippocampus zosterae]|uniref:drebrin-like protein B isoform X2 n=1 Tax=Hippocampus zosterae TaxID=109293 RepID=UPI00223E0A46|nr:drebrin-like protein B isoform X2 [Hippocampus zosterae]